MAFDGGLCRSCGAVTSGPERCPVPKHQGDERGRAAAAAARVVSRDGTTSSGPFVYTRRVPEDRDLIAACASGAARVRARSRAARGNWPTRFHQRQQHRLPPRGRLHEQPRRETGAGDEGSRRRVRRANRCWRSTRRSRLRRAAPRLRSSPRHIAHLHAAAYRWCERIQRHHIGARHGISALTVNVWTADSRWSACSERPTNGLSAPVGFALRFQLRRFGTPSYRPEPAARRHDARRRRTCSATKARATRPTASADRCGRHHAGLLAGGSRTAAATARASHRGSRSLPLLLNASEPARARSVARIKRAVASSAAATRDHSNIRVFPFAPSAAARIARARRPHRASTQPTARACRLQHRMLCATFAAAVAVQRHG